LICTANGEPVHVNGNHSGISPQLFVLSSFDQDGISRLSNAYKEYLPRLHETLYNLSYTLAAKRSQFNWRAAIVADSVDSLQEALSEKPTATRVATDGGLGFIFTGQGAQWAQMGMGLVHYPVFRQSLELADAHMRKLGSPWSALGEYLSSFRSSILSSFLGTKNRVQVQNDQC
jgi:acyl transferase domain-containing protein